MPSRKPRKRYGPVRKRGYDQPKHVPTTKTPCVYEVPAGTACRMKKRKGDPWKPWATPSAFSFPSFDWRNETHIGFSLRDGTLLMLRRDAVRAVFD